MLTIVWRCKNFFGAVGLIFFVATLNAQISLQDGNLVVYRVGNGITPLNSNAFEVSLLEFQQDGTLVQTYNMPTSSPERLTASGSATSEGKLRYNGGYLAVTGYDAAVGTANVKDTSATSTPRRVTVLQNNLSATAQTTTLGNAFSGDNIRSAIPQANGSGVWITGHASNTSNGVWYHDFTSNTTTQIVSNENLRTLHIHDGQLYSGRLSSGGNVQTVGTGLPTTSTTLTNLPGNPTGQSIFIADLAGGKVMYVTTDSGTLTKYSLVSGSWVSNGTSVNPSLGTFYDLTGYVDSSGNVRLFAVSPTNLVTITDSNGFNTSFGGTFTSLATAGTNYAFRGITYVPEPSLALVLVLFAVGAIALRRSNFLFQVACRMENCAGKVSAQNAYIARSETARIPYTIF